LLVNNTTDWAIVFLTNATFAGFPNTLVEAQSLGGVPVLFNSFPVAEWLAGDGANGQGNRIKKCLYICRLMT
jgi:hypothetical protein